MRAMFFGLGLVCLWISSPALASDDASVAPATAAAAELPDTVELADPAAMQPMAAAEVLPRVAVDPADPRGAAASKRALEYREWTSRPHASTDALPTVIVLHGWGGTPEKILPIAQFQDLDVRVIAPQAPFKSRRGYTWIAHLRENGTSKSATAEADASMADLVALVARLQTERPMAGKPILVGFSLGGSMAYGLSIYHPELFEQVVIVAGPMPPKVIPEQASAIQAALPVRAIHLEGDPVVNADRSEEAILRLAAAGFDATFQRFPGAQHRVSDAERAWMRDAFLKAWPHSGPL